MDTTRYPWRYLVIWGSPALSLTLILILTLTLSLDLQPLNCIADDLPNCVYL
jgi:hypothetical protein